MTTVGQIIDLIDYNRDGQKYVMISEKDEDWCKVYTDTVMIDLISDMQVDSILAEDDVIKIYLHDNSVTGYWEQIRQKEKEKGHE